MKEKIGHFRIVDQIGKGGMGVVYAAHDESLDRAVALKVLPVFLSYDEKLVARFRKEARAAARLSHPHIVRIHSIGEDKGLHYFVMELVEGCSLQDVIESGGPLPVERALRIAAQIAEALDYAHRAGFIHRDIKPSNIMLAGEDFVKVTDFGLVKALQGDPMLTTTGSLLGTPAYVAPEQIEGKEVDGRSDVYSLGAVLYQMLSGSLPFEGESLTNLVRKILHEKPPALKSLRPEVPGSVVRLVQRAMAKKPAARFDGAAAFLASVRSILGEGGEPVEGPPRRRRKPVLVAVVVPLFVVVLALSAWLVLGRGRPPPKVPGREAPPPERRTTAPPAGGEAFGPPGEGPERPPEREEASTVVAIERRGVRVNLGRNGGVGVGSILEIYPPAAEAGPGPPIPLGYGRVEEAEEEVAFFHPIGKLGRKILPGDRVKVREEIEDMETLLSRARKAEGEGAYEEALNHYREIQIFRTATRLDRTENRLRIGNCLLRIGRNREAATMLRDAALSLPHDRWEERHKAFFRAAQAFEKSGQLPPAVRCYEDAANAMPPSERKTFRWDFALAGEGEAEAEARPVIEMIRSRVNELNRRLGFEGGGRDRQPRRRPRMPAARRPPQESFSPVDWEGPGDASNRRDARRPSPRPAWEEGTRDLPMRQRPYRSTPRPEWDEPAEGFSERPRFSPAPQPSEWNEPPGSMSEPRNP